MYVNLRSPSWNGLRNQLPLLTVSNKSVYWIIPLVSAVPCSSFGLTLNSNEIKGRGCPGKLRYYRWYEFFFYFFGILLTCTYSSLFREIVCGSRIYEDHNCFNTAPHQLVSPYLGRTCGSQCKCSTLSIPSECCTRIN